MNDWTNCACGRSDCSERANSFIDLGSGHVMEFVAWKTQDGADSPYGDTPDEPRLGVHIGHHHADGSECWYQITLDVEAARKLFPNRNRWTVESWDPLTLSPSISVKPCGDHGFIKQGIWVSA